MNLYDLDVDVKIGLLGNLGMDVGIGDHRSSIGRTSTLVDGPLPCGSAVHHDPRKVCEYDGAGASSPET